MKQGEIHEVTGDATKPQGRGKKIIAHVVNNVGKFGAGFSGALDKRYKLKPGKSYHQWYADKEVYGAPFELGEVLFTNVAGPRVMVAHMLCQKGVGTNKRRIDYNALSLCLQRVFEAAQFDDYTVHMPRIGAGLAGGDWSEIMQRIKTAHAECGYKVDTYIYTLEEG